MLVLRRRAGEAIAIGGDIEIEVIEISRTRVKLGVRAPREISVARRELISVAAENQQALQFLEGRGRESMSEILTLLKKSPAECAKESGRLADKFFEDTAGIPTERENPGPA